MRRADRLFDIIQVLRTAKRPTTAAALADHLEVTVRTVYRDIATLQARRVPIEGAAGLGYMLRRGFDLPPLMFTTEEVDAIAVGVRLVHRLRDPALQDAAASVLAKIAAVLPDATQAYFSAAPFVVSEGSAVVPDGVDLSAIRGAIRDRRKLRLAYRDQPGRLTRRTIWPIALAYYVDVTLVAAWCELRSDYRHFRVDRIETLHLLAEHYPPDEGRLLAGWLALGNDGPTAPEGGGSTPVAAGRSSPGQPAATLGAEDRDAPPAARPADLNAPPAARPESARRAAAGRSGSDAPRAAASR